MSEQQTEAPADTDAATDPTAPTAPIVVEVQNPNAEEMRQLMEHVNVNYDFDVDVKPVTFNFKKSKDKDTGIETIRKPVELAIPYPSMAGIIAILEGVGEKEKEDGSKETKGLDLLVEAIEGVVNAIARDMLYEDLSLNAATFPVEKLSWLTIASMPKAQRRGGGIPKEVWEAFTTDYVAIMPEATGKTEEQVGNAAKILMNKLSAVKTNEPVLKMLVQQLAVYAEASPNVEEYAECVEFLLTKADTFLNLSPEDLLANL